MALLIPISAVGHKYYFDFRDGQNIERDEAGTEYPSAESAIKEAVSALIDIARDMLSASDGDRYLSFDIASDAREPLFSVEMHFVIRRIE